MSLANHAKKASEAAAATAATKPAVTEPIEGTATVVEETIAPVNQTAESQAAPSSNATEEKPAAAAAEAKTTEVTTASAPKPPAVSSGGGEMMTALQEDGFEGLKLGFGAFPGIVLPAEGRFKINGEEKFIGEAFSGRIHSSKPKWIVKVDTNDKDKEKYVYTYDNPRDPNAMTTGGTKVVDFIADVEASGQRTKVKDYLDVLFEIDECSEESLSPGDLVLLSIPDTSIKRFSGYLLQLQMRKTSPRDVITRVSVGAKITSVAKPYYPWSFKMDRQG